MREYFMKAVRIGFSLWREGDAALAEALWGKREVTRFLCAMGNFSQQEVLARLALEMSHQARCGVQYWPLFCLEGGAFIGCCGLRPYQLERKIYELGFHLLPAFWGKGHATEAATAAMDYAFATVQARGLFAGHHPGNAGSAAVLKKLGFRHTHDEYYEPTGLQHPSYLYQRDVDSMK